MKKFISTIIAVLLLSTAILASSPITLVSFYLEYANINEVGIMEESGALDGRVMPFLLDENNPIIQKAAVINALVNTDKPRYNASTFKQFIARNYKDNFETMDINKLNGHELFCLGYLTLIDDMGNPDNALPILTLALEKNKNSQTVHMIHSIASAQQFINKGNKCEGWDIFENNRSNTSLNNDMGNNIVSYFQVVMETYKEGCE
ncbi:MAG: hypothetical protein R2750_03775 [Bacteroidales bacterium]